MEGRARLPHRPCAHRRLVPRAPGLVGAAQGARRTRLMRVLVTGAGGQFGHDFAALCSESGDDVVAVDRAALDVGDRRAVSSAIDNHRPDIVVNAAAWTAVDACES